MDEAMEIERRAPRSWIDFKRLLATKFKHSICCVFHAILDMAITFFPMIILMFVLFVDNRLETLRSLADPALIGATLYAEGSWKIRRGETLDDSALYIIGVIGAVVGSVVVAIIVLSHNPDHRSLEGLVQSQNFEVSNVWLFGTSILFGLYVRFKLQSRRPEDTVNKILFSEKD